MCLSIKKYDKDIEKKEFDDGSLKYYKDSLLHNNNDRPAIIKENRKEWWFHGMRHRENDKPAIIYEDGSKEWWFYGMRHRGNNKPAVVLRHESFNYTYFTKEWWFYGKLHRSGNKPALMRSNGMQEHWEYGRMIK